MSLDCTIVIPGVDAGVRGNGAPKVSKTGPVRDFLKDSEHYYRAVWRHVRGCGACDPKEVLDGFLENRKTRHFGQTSSLLVAMAEKYQKGFPLRIPNSLVREYVVRAMSSWPTFEKRVPNLSVEEVLRAEALYMDHWRQKVVKVGVRKDFRLHHAFYEAQGYIGWLNDSPEREYLGESVPDSVRRASSMTREGALAAGGLDLAVWLVTRHDWRTALLDPVAGGVMANVLAGHVLDA